MAYRKRYNQNRDPYWTEARFASTCTCGKRISKGSKIYYFPNGKTAHCEPCGKVEAKAMQAELSFDRFGTDCAYDC